MAYDIGNRILVCSFLRSSHLLTVNGDLDVVNYGIKCVRKWCSANMMFARYTRMGKAINLKSNIVSRGGDAINFGWCTMDCNFAEMSSRTCELSSVNCKLGTVNCCFALNLAIFTITGDLGDNFAPFWTPSDVSWNPIVGLLELFERFSSHFGSRFGPS